MKYRIKIMLGQFAYTSCVVFCVNDLTTYCAKSISWYKNHSYFK